MVQDGCGFQYLNVNVGSQKFYISKTERKNFALTRYPSLNVWLHNSGVNWIHLSCDSFVLFVQSFLGSHEAENDFDLMNNMLTAYKRRWCWDENFSNEFGWYDQ